MALEEQKVLRESAILRLRTTVVLLSEVVIWRICLAVTRIHVLMKTVIVIYVTAATLAWIGLAGRLR